MITNHRRHRQTDRRHARLRFALFIVHRAVKTGGRIYTIYTSNDADSPKDVPFGVSMTKTIVQGIKTPKTPPKVGVVRQFYKPEVRKIEIAISSTE